MSEQESDSFKLIDAGSDLLGVLAAGATTAALYHDASTIVAGPIAVGIAYTFRYGANLFASRLLARREKARVGAVYALAAHEVKRRLDNGEQPRTDDFFDRDLSDRSKADEIAEGIFVAAQREHEEKKLPYLANLLAFIVFEARMDVGIANYMIKTANALTYRQFCILSIADNPAKSGLEGGPLNQKGISPQAKYVQTEIFELYLQRLVGFNRGPILQLNDMPLEQLRLNELGTELHLAMRLDTIASADIANLIVLLNNRYN